MYTEKPQIDSSYLDAKRDEHYYLRQVVKHLQHLQHIYYSGRLENKIKAKQIEASLNNYATEMDWVKTEIRELVHKHEA